MPKRDATPHYEKRNCVMGRVASGQDTSRRLEEDYMIRHVRPPRSEGYKESLAKMVPDRHARDIGIDAGEKYGGDEDYAGE